MPDQVREAIAGICCAYTMLKRYSTSGSATTRIPRRWRAADLSEGTTMSDPENLLARWSRRKAIPAQTRRRC